MTEATSIARERKTDINEEIMREAAGRIQNNGRKKAPPPPEGGITSRQAERKFGIHHGTISEWVKQGYIDIILKTNREIYLKESQLKKVIEEYKKNPGQGRFTLRYLFGKGHPRSHGN